MNINFLDIKLKVINISKNIAKLNCYIQVREFGKEKEITTRTQRLKDFIFARMAFQRIRKDVLLTINYYRFHLQSYPIL